MAASLRSVPAGSIACFGIPELRILKEDQILFTPADNLAGLLTTRTAKILAEAAKGTF